MKRIHTCIAKTKKEDKKLREGRLKENDPFMAKVVRKMVIPKALQYAEEEELAFGCTLRSIREGECSSREEKREIQAITNSISHIRWRSEMKGVTWLELYVWYRMQSPRFEVDPLATSKPLLNEIALFKSRVRKVATYRIKDEQEWVLSTCYRRQNRRKNAAVSNKHAAIQGMPNIPKEEAGHMLRVILEMKGAQTKKHKKAHGEGILAIHRKPLAFRGTARHRHKNMVEHENCTTNGINDIENGTDQIILRTVACPRCLEPSATSKLKRKANSIFPI